MQTFAGSSQNGRSGAHHCGGTGGRLFADLATCFHAFGLSHCLEAVTFANALTFAGILRSLAIVHACARCHAVAVHLNSVSSLCLRGNTSKQSRCGESESGTGSGVFEVHFYILGNRQGGRLDGLFSPDTALERAAPNGVTEELKKFSGCLRRLLQLQQWLLKTQ
jgi:hypothetical protein